MKTLIAIAFLTFIAPAFSQTHGHINAGATDTNGSGGINAGDRLFMYFETGTQLTTLASNSGSGTYGSDGFWWNGYTTFTSLHQSSFPGQSPNYNSLGASSGSFLTLDLVSVAGPVGAKFAFYESGTTDPLWIYQVGTGLLSGSGAIPLTEQSWFDGSPEDGLPSDPFGHLHGRMFGVDGRGDFTATWILKDTKTGTTGLLDSAPFTSSFSAIAVPEPATWVLLGAGVGLLVLRKYRARPLRSKRTSQP